MIKCMPWHFWIDRGGTFTDIVARTPAGALITRKLLSENPGQYDDAAVAGMREILAEHGELDDLENRNEKPLESRLRGNDGGGDVAPFPAHKIAAIKMGTTVATNALLERKGAATVFAVTQGFADVLRIGTQNRPRLFDLNIQLPEMLYAAVVEIPERVAATGEVLRALDEPLTRARLTEAFNTGARSLAVALMHGYRFGAHERRVAEIARHIGFTHISASHITSPLMKLVGRGDTTVVDAYLSPLLRRYVDQVSEKTNHARLLFMQSNGGLADAHHFQGKDAVLSGPAGGVVGAAETARAAGFARIIGFDMGGTSNVLLGKIQAAHFPAVFGDSGHEKLNAAIVREKFETLAQQVSAATGQARTPEDLAEGFLALAIDSMARAIRTISVQRGYDVTKYTLACFGGAGGQHACLVADALGMTTVFIHPLAGVLSAYGIGLAKLRAVKERTVEAPLTDAGMSEIAAALNALCDEARETLVQQGVDAAHMTLKRRVHLKYKGTDTALEVEFADARAMQAAFAHMHKAHFGFVMEGRALICITRRCIPAPPSNPARLSSARPSSPKTSPPPWSRSVGAPR